MQSNEIKQILKENKEAFEILENYDKTHELPFQRKRIDITLSVATINKLKKCGKKQASRFLKSSRRKLVRVLWGICWFRIN